MKVLHVVPSISSSDGGPSQAIIDIERALSQRSIEVVIAFTKATTDSTPQQETNLSALNRVGFVRNTELYKFSSDLGRWLQLTVSKFDLVHVHSLFSYAPIAAARAARRSGIPYIVRPLGVLRQYGMRRRRALLKRISLNWIERPMLEASAAVHYTSYAEKMDADALGLRCRSAVIPLGIDISAIEAKCNFVESDEFKLLLISRLDPVKNIEALLKAFATLTMRYPNIILQIAGDGPPSYVRSLRTLAQNLNIESRVRWLGFVQGSQKRDLLSKASLFVLPSHSESFGIAAVEALASGLPCVVSNGVAIATDIHQAGAGIVTEPRSPELSAGISRLLESPSELMRMSAAARQLAETSFSLEVMGARLETLYRAICKHNGEGLPCLI